MTRLAIFTTHPIQYQAPWFRALAAIPGIELEVFFSYVPDAIDQGVGFGTPFEWDLPLREGYLSSVLRSRKLPARVPEFARRLISGVGVSLDRFRPDVALLLGWQELSLSQSLFACHSRGIPVILRGESNNLRQRPLAVKVLHQHYFSLFDAFLAIGSANRQLYIDAGVPNERILTAGYFVDNERFRSQADERRGLRMELRHKWSIPPSDMCALFVGKLEPKKCVLHFLEAVGRARNNGANIHALVVGTGEQMSAAKALSSQSHVPVSFAGFLNQNEIVDAYVAADFLVLPSDFGETWGLVVNEAMATGLPAVVSNRVGCANDLVLHDQTGIVFEYGDINALEAALGKFVTCPHLCRELGSKATQRVISEYSIGSAVEKTREAIELATGRRDAAA